MVANYVDADRTAKQAFDPFICGGIVDGAETIILEVAKARHEAKSEEMAQREDVIVRSAGVRVMLSIGVEK